MVHPVSVPGASLTVAQMSDPGGEHLYLFWKVRAEELIQRWHIDTPAMAGTEKLILCPSPFAFPESGSAVMMLALFYDEGCLVRDYGISKATVYRYLEPSP